MPRAFTGVGRDGEKHLRLAFVWALAGALATILAIPYELDLLSAKLRQAPVRLPVIFTIQTVQVFVLLLVAVWIGLRVGSPIGLDSPIARAVVYRRARPPWSWKRLAVAAVVGSLIGIALEGRLEGVPPVPAWKGFLVSFYGGITEELLLRLFAMSLLGWIGWRLFERARPAPSAAVFWIANVLAALLFGASHLPAAGMLWSVTPSLAARVVLTNAVAGVVYGLIFWRWGIEHAMVCHFFTDVFLHAIFSG